MLTLSELGIDTLILGLLAIDYSFTGRWVSPLRKLGFEGNFGGGGVSLATRFID